MSAFRQRHRRRSYTGSHILPQVGTRQLDFGKGLGIQDTIASGMCTFFSHVKLPGQLEFHSRPSEKAAEAVLLVRKQPIGSKISMETMVQATRTSLKELRVRVVRTMVRLQGGRTSHPGQAGSAALTAGTDLQTRHRLTLESTMGSEGDKQTLSASISSDFTSRLAWGVACSYKLDPKVTVFSRYSSDASAGRRLILQGVGRVGTADTISAMWALPVGRPSQAALSWTHVLPGTGDHVGESVQLKFLYGGSGAFVLSWKAQVGENN